MSSLTSAGGFRWRKEFGYRPRKLRLQVLAKLLPEARYSGPCPACYSARSLKKKKALSPSSPLVFFRLSALLRLPDGFYRSPVPFFPVELF